MAGDGRDKSRPIRYQIGELVVNGVGFKRAEDEVFRRERKQSNRKKYIIGYINNNLWPYGVLDIHPDTTVCDAVSKFSIPKIKDENGREFIEYFDSVVTMKDSVVQKSVFQNTDIEVQSVAQQNDTVVMPNDITQRIAALEADVAKIKDRLHSSSPELQIRPKLIRNTENTVPRSIRIPEKLWKLAQKKIKKDSKGQMGLNGLIELWLFDYIGRPDELLEKE